MATHATSDLIIVNGMPAADKLWNDRWRLEFFCDPSNKEEGWYSGNIDKWIPAFGSLQDHAIENGWAYPKNSEVAFDDMRLVEGGTQYVPAAGDHFVKLVYETLTAAWAQEKDDTVTYSENGLERISRVSVALPDTSYTSVVGTTTITNDGTTLYLAAREIDETDAKWTLSETWAEAGKLSESDPITGPNRIRQKTVVWQGVEGTAPTGYVGASRKTDNVEGFPTITVTYYFSADLSQEFPAYTTTVPFTMPGTIDWRYKDLGVIGVKIAENYMVDISPPVTTLCEASVVDSYTTNPDLVDINAVYQPNYWTRVIVEGVGINYRAFSTISTHINHIAKSSGKTVTEQGNTFVQGNLLFAGTTGIIDIDGPTYDPAGQTIIINDNADPIFTLLDGTQYYKRTVTTINVPARNS